jgi:hypothetical protein
VVLWCYQVVQDVSNVKKEDEDEPMDVNVEYVSEQLDIKGSALEAFSDVFARFQTSANESSVRVPLLSLAYSSHRFPGALE